MKNRTIVQAREEVAIYKAYYRPSMNLWRFVKSILGVLIFGNSNVARSYVPARKRSLR
jgi:hypothetical protein